MTVLEIEQLIPACLPQVVLPSYAVQPFHVHPPVHLQFAQPVLFVAPALDPAAMLIRLDVGSQLIMLALGDSAGVPLSLLRWELPTRGVPSLSQDVPATFTIRNQSADTITIGGLVLWCDVARNYP